MSVLPPGSAFSQAVFKTIRPGIPRERWPAEPVRATFTPGMDGFYLIGDFEGLGQSYGILAARMVVDAGVELVLISPAAPAAAAVVRAKRWRDMLLFLAAPMLFAIPMLGMLADALMKVSAGMFALNALALIVAQVGLSHQRGRLAGTRFVADIPSPGYRLQLATAQATAPAQPPVAPPPP